MVLYNTTLSWIWSFSPFKMSNNGLLSTLEGESLHDDASERAINYKSNLIYKSCHLIYNYAENQICCQCKNVTCFVMKGSSTCTYLVGCGFYYTLYITRRRLLLTSMVMKKHNCQVIRTLPLKINHFLYNTLFPI